MLFESSLRKIANELVNLRDGHPGVTSHKRDFNNFLRKDLETIKGQSFRRLKRTMDHAYRTSPYYRETWDRIGFKPSDLKCPEEIEKIPFLSKDIIEENKEQMISTSFKQEDLEMSHTGGTSGTHTSFYQDRKCVATRVGRQLGILETCGYNVGDRCGFIWGFQEDLLPEPHGFNIKSRFRSFSMGKEVLPCAVLSAEKMTKYHARLLKFRPKILYGYPNAMAHFAKFIEEEGLGKIAVERVICTAERLAASHRSLLEEVFGGEVFNLYCTREHGCVAFECNRHHGFHIDSNSVHVEVIIDGRHARPGETGEIVITDLLNFGMPFIRYKLGDRGAFSVEQCSCGCSTPMLGRLDGREMDLVYKPDGSAVTVMDVLTDVPGIKEIQIIQNDPMEVEFYVAVREEYTEEIERIAVAELRKQIGYELRIKVKKVREIPRNPVSGKFREVICNIQPPVRP